jgi:hypothetical protein
VKPVLAILALLCIAAMPPNPPKSRHYKSGEVPRGAGSRALIAKVVIPVARTNAFLWKFPEGLHPESYFWNIEASSDLANWTVVISNASGATEVRVKRTDPPGFYRLCGRPSP